MLAQPPIDRPAINSQVQVYDFMHWSYVSFTCSMLLLLTSIFLIVVRGFNWGLDFTGGTLIELHLEKNVDVNQIRYTLKQAHINVPLVQQLSTSHDLLVRFPPVEHARSQKINNQIVNLIN